MKSFDTHLAGLTDNAFRPIRLLPGPRLRALMALACITLISACGDPDPQSSDASVPSLEARIELLADTGTGTVSALGVLGTKAGQEGSSAFRLVDGDRLYLLWEGRTQQLYRRGAEFRYVSHFNLPAGRNLIAGLQLESARRDVAEEVQSRLPDIASFQLQQTAQAISSEQLLTLSWLLDLDEAMTSGTELIAVMTRVRPLRCIDVAGNTMTAFNSRDVESVWPLNATSVEIAAESLFARQRLLGADRCEFDIRLIVDTADSSSDIDRFQPNVRLNTRTLSAPARFEILNASSNAHGRDNAVMPVR